MEHHIVKCLLLLLLLWSEENWRTLNELTEAVCDCRGEFLKSCIVLTDLIYLLFPLHTCRCCSTFQGNSSIVYTICVLCSWIKSFFCFVFLVNRARNQVFDLQTLWTSIIEFPWWHFLSQIGASRDICYSPSDTYIFKSSISSRIKSWHLYRGSRERGGKSGERC